MKISVIRTDDVEITYIRMVLPIRYGEEDIPAEFPGRDGDKWTVVVDLATGRIVNWPAGYATGLQVYMKVVDEGCYYLLDNNLNVISQLVGAYVPHGVVPGEWGDYVQLDIRPDGTIANWPKNLTSKAFEAFFPARTIYLLNRNIDMPTANWARTK